MILFCLQCIYFRSYLLSWHAVTSFLLTGGHTVSVLRNCIGHRKSADLKRKQDTAECGCLRPKQQQKPHRWHMAVYRNDKVPEMLLGRAGEPRQGLVSTMIQKKSGQSTLTRALDKGTSDTEMRLEM